MSGFLILSLLTALWRPAQAPVGPGDLQLAYRLAAEARSKGRIRRMRLVPPNCAPLPETLRALAHADIITIGPGSLFTSVIPNLLVSGMPAAIREAFVAAWES